MNWERTIFGVMFFIETGRQWDGPCCLAWSVEVGAGALRLHLSWEKEL